MSGPSNTAAPAMTSSATAPVNPSPSSTETPPANGTPQPTEEQVFYQGGYTQDPKSHDFNADPSCGGEPELWAGLLSLDADLQPVPDWAVSWEASRDATTWTFYLRPHNRGWSNGDPVTAGDFVWSWQRQLNPAVPAAHSSLLVALQNGSQIAAGRAKPETLGAAALDDWTLRVTLATPSAGLPTLLAGISTVPAHRKSVEQFGAAWTEAGHCVSNGPFKLDRWQRNVRYTISRNDNYWNMANVALSKCVTPILSADAGLNAYLADQIDQVTVPGSALTGVRGDDGLATQLDREVDTAIWMLLPQTNRPPFDSLRVRQALSHAIDRGRTEQVLLGRAAAAHSLMPLGFPLHFEDSDIVALQQFDVDAALGALQATPFSGGANWPAFSLSMRQADPDAQLIAQDVTDQLNENLGMNLRLDVLAPADFDAAFAAGRLPLVLLRWWFSDADPDAGYGAIFASNSPTRPPLAWSSPQYDQLAASAQAELTSTRRASRYQQCERLLQSQVAYIPVVYPVTYYLFQPWVKDLPTNHLGDLRTNGAIFTRLKASLRIEGRASGESDEGGAPN